MTNLARSQHADAQQHRIAVAVRPRRHDLQAITGGFSFGPQRLPSAAVKRNEAANARKTETKNPLRGSRQRALDFL